MKKILFATLLAVLCVGVQAKEATTKYELALINAAKEGNAAQVRGLLEAGTDPNITDKDGNTPLIYVYPQIYKYNGRYKHTIRLRYQHP